MNKHLGVLLGLLVVFSACDNALKKQITNAKANRSSVTASLEQARGLVGTQPKYGELFSHYEAIRAALVADDFAGVGALGQALSLQVRETLAADASAQGITQNVEKASAALGQQSNPKASRKVFGDLSRAVIDLYRLSQAKGFSRFRCPMVADGFGDWIQPEPLKIANPYMGQKMVACGYQVPMDDEAKL